MPETPSRRPPRDRHRSGRGRLARQDRDRLGLTAGRGVAVREFPLKRASFADYLLYLDRKAVGAVSEAAGTLTGVEAQSASTPPAADNLPAHKRLCRFCSRRTAR
jgi:type I restriction enzyme R subunit